MKIDAKSIMSLLLVITGILLAILLHQEEKLVCNIQTDTCNLVKQGILSNNTYFLMKPSEIKYVAVDRGHVIKECDSSNTNCKTTRNYRLSFVNKLTGKKVDIFDKPYKDDDDIFAKNKAQEIMDQLKSGNNIEIKR